MMDLVFASNNVHKLEEIRKILPKGCKIISLHDAGIRDELPETGNTLKANALQKARYVFDRINGNCFADDTGLEVDVLEGRPGVYSARYAGLQCSANDNIVKLLKELNGVSDRKAVFKTVIAAIINGKEFFCEGKIEGTITFTAKGTSGFGYDPVFIPSGSAKTFAEMTGEEKNKISHRARAIEQFAKIIC